MNQRKLKRQKETKFIYSLQEVRERAATNSDTRFTATAHGSAYIRKDVRHVDHMSNSKRQAGNKMFFRCDGTLVHQAFNMTPKEKIHAG